ncbi:EAL domain-containing protein [Novosphingobium umbonatum]|uniref:EAL domain-containing protein n=1 Tax=Novosphingobium umbonatum TaxID=1908524 RepID=A0A3S2VEV3_9SPHN|nr:EAL domain-containing protein [Novosphingobium umbonatum]RVU06334.1 EAL domain-containing protein [Novosphingobium umbonatum]
MPSLLTCIAYQHQPWLVAMAAAICLATAISGTSMLRRAHERRALHWMVAAGLSTGFGVWSTHFVAMLGYLPGVPVSYLVWPTLLSLALVMGGIVLGFALALGLGVGWKGTRQAACTLGAMVVGGSVAAMHYLGMSALEMPASIRWNEAYVLASLVASVVPLYPAFQVVLSDRPLWQAAGWLTLGVVLLHFTGMTAMELVPSRMAQAQGLVLAPAVMSAVVGLATGLQLTLCAVAMMVSRRMWARLQARERDFSILVKGISDCALYMLTPQGKVANWNAGAQRLKGYTAEEVVGEPLARFYTMEDRARGAPQRALAIAHDEGKFTGEGYRCRKDGTTFWAHVTIEKIVDEEGQFIGFAKITRDMTRFKQDQDQLAAMKGQLDMALDNMHQGLALFDADERLVLCNRRLSQLWGVEPDAITAGMTLGEVLSVLAKGDGELRAQLEMALVAYTAEPGVLACREDFVLSVISRPLAEGGWVSTFEDITESRRTEARLAHMARHDPLTGLPNRAHFGEWCAVELEQAARHGLRFAMVAMDLEQFRTVNDVHGYAGGDQALRAIAARLQAACGEGEWVARLGGDEFAAGRILENDQQLSDFLTRLQSCFEGEESVGVNAKFGVALSPADGPDRETLLVNADLAVQRAKASFGEMICYYQSEMDEAVRTRRQIAADLRYAVERQELRLLYQPQHAVQTGELVGYEVLVRWVHGTRGMISPMDFIPIAEETGDILAIGEWVLREAAMAAAQWDNGLKVAVNLSPVQLQQPDLVRRITEILLESGLPPKRLELEITESAIISDKLQALHMLRQIKALGISIAMDDFGTGYSSLDTLHSFPFDKIKIDKSFLMQSSTSPQAAAILRAVLALGRSLKIPVLAEGVETPEQLELLLSEGCAEGQGYLYGRPQPLEADGAPLGLGATG